VSLSTAGPYLVTGVAGFIGFHLADLLLQEGARVIGVDSLNAYYDPRLKDARLERLQTSRGRSGFTFVHQDLADREATAALFAREKPGVVAHLAAQAGVRYSLSHPHAYADANLVGFLNILEGCRQNEVAHLVFASTSSVYGLNTHMPFSVHDNVDHPVSLYAATKKSNELMAHCYSHLYGLPVTGLRFFTVYGPWGRPDMAYFSFTKAILEGRPIEVFNEGRMKRDFTYIDDIAEGVRRVLDRVPEGDPAWSSDAPDPGTSRAPYRLYNIGNNQPVELMTMIETLERALGREAQKIHRPMQPGDVVATWADIDDLERAVGFRPSTPIEDGLQRFVAWYRDVWQPLIA
jgi:UDP-glucuronate 4-epimerase